MGIFKNVKKVHFIGVLGSSMSNLALISKALGFSVSGSDKNDNSLLSNLKKKGIDAYLGADAKRVKSADLVVYSSAVPESDSELKSARKFNKQVLPRAEFLGELSSLFDKVIAVSGTHGKSTVTAMLGEIFSLADYAPCVHLGGAYKDFGKFETKYFITEACEYKESFLTLTPDVAIVLNVESDHPDYFKSMSELYRAFTSFIERSKPNAPTLIGEKVKISDEDKLKIGRDAYTIKTNEKDGFFTFVPVIRGKTYPTVSLKVRGEHNVENALFALLVADIEGIKPEIAVKAIEGFSGVGRRYQTVGKINGATVISDYAHHPTEIIASIKTAKLHSKTVTVYFQPHTYSRTEKLFSSFLSAFDGADKLIIVEEYPARETPDMGKSAKELADALSLRRKCTYASLRTAKELLYSTAYVDETILLIGAGNIDTIFDR